MQSEAQRIALQITAHSVGLSQCPEIHFQIFDLLACDDSAVLRQRQWLCEKKQ